MEGHSTRRAWYYGQRRALPPLVFCMVIGVILVVTARTVAGAVYGIVMTVCIGVSAWRLWREPVLSRDKAQKMQQRRERIGMHPLRSAALSMLVMTAGLFLGFRQSADAGTVLATSAVIGGLIAFGLYFVFRTDPQYRPSTNVDGTSEATR